MDENEIIDEGLEEIVEVTEGDTLPDIQPDILDDVSEVSDLIEDDFENLEDTENEAIESEDVEDSSADVIGNDEEISISGNDIEELPENMTEEFLEELSSEGNEYILYMSEQETEVPFLQKSFTEYSTTESLLLLIFVILFLWFLKNTLFD